MLSREGGEMKKNNQQIWASFASIFIDQIAQNTIAVAVRDEKR